MATAAHARTCLTVALLDEDVLARYGGEEFVANKLDFRASDHAEGRGVRCQIVSPASGLLVLQVALAWGRGVERCALVNTCRGGSGPGASLHNVGMDRTAVSHDPSDALGKVLVTGGVRSGKSTHAESLLAGATAVTYVAAGPTYDDADWVARVTRHQARRPASWRTVESTDVAAILAATAGPVLVECLGTWLAAAIDEAHLWEAPMPEVVSHIADRVTALVDVLEAAVAPVVVVTNEVGFGVVPEHRSGRVFRDLLGTANQRLAAACDEVHLIVAGRVLRL